MELLESVFLKVQPQSRNLLTKLLIYPYLKSEVTSFLVNEVK